MRTGRDGFGSPDESPIRSFENDRELFTFRPGHREIGLLPPSGRYRSTVQQWTFLALPERQRQPRATPWQRSNPTMWGHLITNRRRGLTKSPPNCFERLTALPAIPQLRLLCGRKTSTKSPIHRHTPSFPSKIKCCVDRLRPPSNNGQTRVQPDCPLL